MHNIAWYALPAYDDRYAKSKLIAYGDNVYTNSCGFNVLEFSVEYQYFIVISFHSLLVYDNKYYLQEYLAHCANKIIDKHIIDSFDDNLFYTDED